MRYEKILEALEQKTGRQRKDIEDIVEGKRLEFGGLISAEGAAHIIAKDFGIAMEKEIVKIGELKNSPATVEGRVTRVLGFREFEKNGRKGKVANVVLADDTGSIKTVFWDRDADLISSGKIKEGAGIRIVNGIVKERDGIREISPGRFGSIEEAKIDFMPVLSAPGKRVLSLAAIEEGASMEIRGCLTKVFETKPFFNDNGKEALMLTGILDDGTGSVRCVFFREAVENIIGKKSGEILQKFKERGSVFEDYRKALGREVVVKGRAKMSSFSQSIEIIVNEVNAASAKNEAEKILGSMGGD